MTSKCPQLSPVSLLPVHWLLLLLLLSATPAFAQQTTAEYQLKAAFLFKFPLYVDWPVPSFAADDSPVVFGIMASEPMFTGLQQLAEGRTLKGRTVVVQRVEPDVAVLPAIHVLFIGREVGAGTEAFLQQAMNSAILTVTETSVPIPANSMINLAVSDDRVQFDVALTPARAAGLSLSARLLQVAQNVSDTR